MPENIPHQHESINLPLKMIYSKAWKTLNSTGINLFMILLVISKEKSIGFSLTYREAKTIYGLPESSFSRAIDSLIGAGFLDIIRQGSGTAREATLYGLSDRWLNYGTHLFSVKYRERISTGKCLHNPAQRGTCSKSDPSKIGFVYLVKIGKAYKIGTSISPKKRFGELTQLPEQPTLVAAEKVFDYLFVEHTLHDMFAHRNIRGEWYQLKPQEVIQVLSYIKQHKKGNEG